jgi:hypothetical protein
MRHYWSIAKYLQYYTLETNGNLSLTDYNTNHNVNFNAFNIDVVYFWQFAPGSEINIVWKSALVSQVKEMDFIYANNFKGSLNSPQNNLLTLKVLYYIDYITIKKAFNKKKNKAEV